MSHTPGPWQIMPEECDRTYIRIRGSLLGGRYKIANVITPIYTGVERKESDETRANARLIAAAPELLEALKLVRSIISDGAAVGFNPNHGDWAERLYASQSTSHAAIAKAEGAK